MITDLQPRVDAKRVRVLAVDDSEDDIAILQYHLELMHGTAVDFTAYSSAERCLEAMAAEKFDVLILDLRIRGTTGIELHGELRRRGIFTPAILVTDQGDEEIAVEAMHSGFADYIPKNVINARSLRRAIQNAVEKSMLRRSLELHRAELERTVLVLRSRNAEIESFYHSLAHELKTPLTSIREFVSIVLDGLEGPVSDGQRELLEIAQSSCDHMVRCIHDLLDSTRLETGKLALTTKRQRLAPVLEEAVVQVESSATEKGVSIRMLAIDEALEAEFDEGRIVQVLSNLMGNAIKFTPAGGEIQLMVEGPEKETDPVTIAVIDNGRGIEPEDMDRIFERLYQTAEVDAAVSGGLGIGLNLCRELVRLHGGVIEVESEVGCGSTFRFTLPVCPVEQPMPQRESV